MLLLRAGRCYGVLEETLPLSSHTIQDDGQILKGCGAGKDGFSEFSWHPLHLESDDSLSSANNAPKNELDKNKDLDIFWRLSFLDQDFSVIDPDFAPFPSGYTRGIHRLGRG